MTKHKDASGEVPQADMFARALETQQRFAAMAWHFNATLLEETAAMNAEVFEFVQRRLEEDFDTAAALGRCESVEEAMETLSAFQRKALDDYSEQTAKISALNTHASDVLIAEVAEDAETVADEMRRQAA